MRTLPADLATLAKNRVRLNGGQTEFYLLTEATAVQRRAFDLLGVPITAWPET